MLFVYFGYTRCPDLCPTTFADLKAALTRLDPSDAARVSAAFVTVDPERDTPEIMNGYLGHFVENVMLLDLTEPLEPGTTIEVTLEFEVAGEVVVEAMVRDDAMHSDG